MSDKLEEAWNLLQEYGTLREASEASGIPLTTIWHRAQRHEIKLLGEKSADNPVYSIEDTVAEDLPIESVIDHLHARFKQKKLHRESKKWIKVKMKSDDPIGLLWLGDPHIDDKYCDWDALKEHIDIIQNNDNVYGCSLGDQQNNWVGRLSRLYGEQETSSKTAWRLVEWLIREMNPLILIGGNHDMWSGSGDPLRWISEPHTVFEDWEARIQLDFPNGRSCRIHAAHDMPGHSQFNPLHAQGKMAKLKGTADLYISGHRHNWALSHVELVEQEKTVWLARARGYKYHDNFAFTKGYEQQKFGQAIMQVIDPNNDNVVSWNQCFADPQEGADYLQYRQSLLR